MTLLVVSKYWCNTGIFVAAIIGCDWQPSWILIRLLRNNICKTEFIKISYHNNMCMYLKANIKRPCISEFSLLAPQFAIDIHKTLKLFVLAWLRQHWYWHISWFHTENYFLGQNISHNYKLRYGNFYFLAFRHFFFFVVVVVGWGGGGGQPFWKCATRGIASSNFHLNITDSYHLGSKHSDKYLFIYV